MSKSQVATQVNKKTNLIAEEGEVIVRTGKERFLTDIVTDSHALHADEPIKLGGTGLGPNPYDFFSAGLGACTTITLRMYADRKNWPLESVTVRLKHHKIHASDCDDCESQEGYVDEIKKEITFTGPLTDEQKKRLLEIADKCPVHRTLVTETKIRTELME
jgi:putative redox protein